MTGPKVLSGRPIHLYIKHFENTSHQSCSHRSHGLASYCHIYLASNSPLLPMFVSIFYLFTRKWYSPCSTKYLLFLCNAPVVLSNSQILRQWWGETRAMKGRGSSSTTKQFIKRSKIFSKILQISNYIFERYEIHKLLNLCTIWT